MNAGADTMLSDPVLAISTNVLWTARYDYEPGWCLQTHRHKFFQIIYFLSGEGRFVLNRSSHAITSGMLVVIAPGVAHGLTAETMVKTLDVKFELGRAPVRRKLLSLPAITTPAGAAIPALMERIREEGEHKGPLYRETCNVYLTEILVTVLKHHHTPLPGPPVVEDGSSTADRLLRQAIEFIRFNYKQDISIGDVTQRLHCSDRVLRRHFRFGLQTSPLDYLQRYRIERAKELILYSDYPLKQIALAVGFKTVHHFTRRFAVIEGVPPAAWRRTHLQGIRKEVLIDPRYRNASWTDTGARPKARA
jgi:AraC-like DNA-binding protein